MNFFSTEINSLSAIWGSDFNIPYMELLLPVGISFYTFQTLSYTIDVYYKRITPEKHLGYFALYVSFWPQLVAGPIERSSRLLPQLRQKVSFQKRNLKEGYTRIMWGFFKKVVVADGVSHVVESIFSSIETQNSLTLIIGAILFTIQIYCDFSGYSDIAIGSARLMGIDLMENF
jgi:D-alanyl-lipoteichoic acid acyltransferase DltB (MBOAT superfamily)